MIDVNEFSHSLGSIVATAYFIEKINKEFKALEDKIVNLESTINHLEKKLVAPAVSAKKTTAKAE